MEDDEDRSQRIYLAAFTTNERTQNPVDIISNYLNHNPHFIIKKNKQLIAFSVVLDNKKPTKIMLCSLNDLNMEYDGINDANCYIIVIYLKKETSKEKYFEIIAYIQKYCDLSKKIYLLGVKKEEEDNKVKITEEEIENRIKDMNVEYEYLELNIDDSIGVSDKIAEIFKYCFENANTDLGKIESEGRSCSIY